MVFSFANVKMFDFWLKTMDYVWSGVLAEFDVTVCGLFTPQCPHWKVLYIKLEFMPSCSP